MTLLDWRVNDPPLLDLANPKYLGLLNGQLVAWLDTAPNGDWILMVLLGNSDTRYLGKSSFEEAKERADREVRQFFKRVGASLDGMHVAGVAQQAIIDAINSATLDAAKATVKSCKGYAAAGIAPFTAVKAAHEAVQSLKEQGYLSPDTSAE